MLCKIPYGQTTTYGEIAQQFALENGGKRTSPRAVGSAVGHNPVSILIPCHRVLGKNGSLTGYAGGLGKKMRLLALEGVGVGNVHSQYLLNQLYP
jgi:methylated-DNA-[protein]-cysteine S-methyltransferase